MKKVIRLTESDLMRIVKRVISEQTNQITPDKFNTLPVTTDENGIPCMLKSGFITYKDNQGNPITIDLTSIGGASGIKLQGYLNVDVNSSIFNALKEYNITLTTTPESSGLITSGSEADKIINNTNDKFIQFINPADDENTILFIKTKKGKYEMLYLNVYRK